MEEKVVAKLITYYWFLLKLLILIRALILVVNVGKEHCSMNISTLFMWLWTDKFVAKFILQTSLNILTKHFQPIIRTGWKRVINDIYFLMDYLPRILAHTNFMYSLLVSGYFLRWAWNSDARSMELREIFTSTWVFDIFNKFLMFYQKGIIDLKCF